MSNPTVVLAAVELQQEGLRLQESSLDVLSSMFFVVGDTMDAVARWAIATVVVRLAAVTATRLCHQAPE